MVKIFISYRRNDSEGYAGRLFDQLTQSFSQADVFMDVDGIAPGENFVDVIEEKLAQIDVMLVIINTNWLTVSDETGRRRIDHPQDFVRKEIAVALNRDIGVIPVLVGAGSMPKVSDLPDDLAPLAYRQAVWLRHNTFISDVEWLAESIKKQSEAGNLGRFQDFSRAIVEEYNSHFILNFSDTDFKLQLFYGSATAQPSLFSSRSLKEALVHLIEAVDIGGWQNHPDEELNPDEFWEAILRAVAASYKGTFAGEFDEINTVTVLRQMISSLESTL